MTSCQTNELLYSLQCFSRLYTSENIIEETQTFVQEFRVYDIVGDLGKAIPGYLLSITRPRRNMGCSGSSLHEPATIAPPPSNQDDHHDNTNNSGVDGGEVKGEKKEESSLEKPKTVNQQKPPMSSEQAGTETATQSSAHKERETIDASQDGSKSKEPKLSPEKTKITNNAKIPNMEHKTTEKEAEVSENREKKERNEPAPENLELDQRKFSATLNKLCLCVDAENFISQIPKNVRKLGLSRAPPHTLSVTSLLSRLSNLQELDVSNNHLGPQAFRLLMLTLASNTSLMYLNAANNGADTDSAVCVGRLLSSNKSLSHLDVSGNHLGKDYLSRCVGPALKTNQTVQTLRLESVGATDMNDLLEGLAENSSIRDLSICNNDISDRESVGIGLAKCLKKQGCALKCINVKNCHMSSGGVESLREGLSVNKSLLELDISGNEFATLDCLMQFLITCFHCTALIQLSADSTKIKGDNLTGEEIPAITEESCFRTLSLSNCGLTPEFISTLESVMKGKLLHLTDLNLSDNPALKASCLKKVATVTSGLSGQSSLTRLTFGLNDAEKIHEFINPGSLPCLEYLNLRKAKISAASVGKLNLLTAPPSGCLKTLVLDGLKLAGTEALKSLLVRPTECSLVALSLSGCQLSDLDITPLTSALKAALPLHMLKLSANRITDKGVTDLVSCLVSQKEHPLAVLDLSNNQIGSEGATALSSLFMSDNHKSHLHSLNLSHNNIGKEGLQTMMRCVGRPLKTVYLNNQRAGLEEGPVADILTELASSMDYVLERDVTGKLKEGSCQIINTDTIYVNLSNLGGHCGEVGRLLDCGSVVTDYRQKQVTSLALSHVCQLAAALRNSETDHVVLSSEEWDLITGCKKDREIPSWLQLAECRERAVYLTNLPGTTTVRRLEGLFEEEDCNVEEICLLKDAVSRKMNGLAWALMSDKESVSRLLDYFYRGEAQVFGQPFLISTLLVIVDNAASEEIAKQARQDVERRARERQSDDATHRSLIRESAEESWKRHAYRLAHPAYADGRVW